MRVSLDIAFTCDILQTPLSAELAGFGLSRSTFNILMILRHAPVEGVQLHDLGELLLVSRANITGLIDHLEQKQFVVRNVNSADRRVRYACITPQGEALLETVVPAHHQTVRSLLRHITADEKEQLVTLLKKLRQSLSAAQ